ncbi:polyvinylalcohol dehydrogenase [Sorangium cellulosum]|uniref:Polyvinylalcohol dehydrogenase n=1 Tax=Sorangium cellulosum TaxID=56 RepID=A0A150TQ88_SORCE|nr:polyvinylalcohol dehydrogenase [Sorangium cellulosum]
MTCDVDYSDVIAENERLRQRIRELERAEEERARLQEALRRSEEHVRLFVTYTPAAFAMFDRDMRYVMASHRYRTDLGLGDQELVGRSHYELFPDVPEHWKAIHQRCLAGASEGNDEEPFPRSDGRVEWGMWKIFPWYAPNGEIGGIMLFTEVITKRKQLEDQLRMQAKTLLELSAPIVPISQGVLVLPLVGALDTARAEQMMENLLSKVVERQARVAIIDVTGVPHIDTASANALLQVARAVRLLGAQVVLTGIRPEVSQAIVGLDIDLSCIVTRRDLQSGIAFATATNLPAAPPSPR